MSVRRVKYRAGDVFSIPLPDGAFAYGRILLDVFRVRRENLFATDCSLNGPYGSGLLVQLYCFMTASPLTDFARLNPSAAFLSEFLADDHIQLGEHTIVGHIPVQPSEIDFPEYVTSHGPARFCFQKGGVVAELATGWRGLLRGVIRDVDYETVQKLPRGSYGLGVNPKLLLNHVRSPTGLADRARSDLRTSPERNRILRLAGLSPAMSYDDMASCKNAPTVLQLLAASR